MIIRFRFAFYALSAALVAASIAFIALWGIPLGIDFTGGALMEVRFSGEAPQQARDAANVAPIFEQHGLSVQVQHAAEDSLVLRFPEIDQETHQALRSDLVEAFPGLQEERFESIGPTIGAETQEKSFVAIGLVLATILVYVAWAFRKLSHPLSSWQYGVVTLVALVHDIIISIGIVVALTHFTGRDVGVPFVAALLTVLGYSVNDTIVIFDRIRENLSRSTGRVPFAELVNKSLKETFVRSFNASITTAIVLVAVLLFGGESIFIFIATLLAGIVVGTYSSIFLANPLLVDWARRKG